MTEPQRGGVGELYSAEYLRDLCERLQSGYISKLIANEKMKRRDYMDCLEFIKRAMVDADLFIEHHLVAASPVKVESGEAVSDAMVSSAYDAFAASAPDAYEYGPDDIRKALEAALSTRRPDDRVNSGTDSGKDGGGAG